MKKIFYLALLFCSIILVGNIHAQTQGVFSETLLGGWNGTGTLFNQKASFKMQWENELNSKFMVLNFENRFNDKSGVERVMNAKAYYNLEQNKGVWFDSRGMILPLVLEINNDSMTVLWGDQETEKGKTIYSLVDDEHMSVEDFVFKDNSYMLFGRALYLKE
ncbi:hypothetical protein [Flagellimonas allohymeniacidonis]|uniref:DUF1579 domain-containing protein n=1 Tax=Flagellimonas allohymeniacidonis TaxID=2517819 RepID=A0A4Q8QKQ5_9FLAO|nr:hypothetical protein [Allomuricauda hymeniacidonis]TAI48826.1 hypothetical protein EW142_03235 [Allomuricauda hymeniacidonis]